MISVVLIGTGNVAQNLFHAFSGTSEVEIRQVVGRTEAHLNFAVGSTQVTTDFKQLLPADVYILAISDDAILPVAMKLYRSNGLLVHTSGGTDLNTFAHEHAGVFYPLQTFTKGKIISFDNIPICIEAKEPEDLQLLKILGASLSDTVMEINSDDRKILHVAAVFVNNFTNYLFTIAEDICNENGLDFNLLKPLIKETVGKLDALAPMAAQTGPAKRGDQKTLHSHLNLLKNKQQRELYTLLSNEIKRKHGEEL